MSKEKPEPAHVITTGKNAKSGTEGTLYLECATFKAAEALAKDMNDQMKKLGLKTTYAAVDKPYPFA